MSAALSPASPTSSTARNPLSPRTPRTPKTPLSPGSSAGRLSGTFSSTGGSPSKQVQAPEAANVRMLSPKEKREALAKNEERRAKIAQAKQAELLKQKLDAIAVLAEERAKREEEKAKKERQDKLDYARTMEDIRRREQAGQERARSQSPSRRPASARRPGGIKLGLKVANSKLGLKVLSVQRDTPAYYANMEENDIIKLVAGKVVHTKEDFDKLVATFKPNSSYPFVLWRNGYTETCHVHVKLSSFASSSSTSGGANGDEPMSPTSPIRNGNGVAHQEEAASSSSDAAAAPASPEQY